MDYREFLIKARESRSLATGIALETRVLSFDPGHTTGWCLLDLSDDPLTIEYGQIPTDPIEVATPHINELITIYDPSIIVCEDYRVYKNRQKHHVGSDLLTSRVIGSIETLATLHMPPLDVVKQPASVGKAFVTNKRLQEWGFFDRSQRHAMDAVRHACHFLLFDIIDRRQRKTKSTSHNVG